ncbi:hypothetical protein, partial [Marinobacter maroccanus]|uniref:hypothetical protein n=1 Tax=Marinobacter maroccanus TaxID=2055143 RepID=UPI001A7E0C8B
VLGQLGGHSFKFFLVQLRTHDGILLKRLLSRGQLHNLVYSLFPGGLRSIFLISLFEFCFAIAAHAHGAVMLTVLVFGALCDCDAAPVA